MGKFSPFVVEWKEAVTPCFIVFQRSNKNHLFHPMNYLTTALYQSDPATLTVSYTAFTCKQP